jgi:hypothetical protein
MLTTGPEPQTYVLTTLSGTPFNISSANTTLISLKFLDPLKVTGQIFALPFV